MPVFDPRASRERTASRLSADAATCSGVKPQWSWWQTSAPRSTSIFRCSMSRNPLATALWRMQARFGTAPVSTASRACSANVATGGGPVGSSQRWQSRLATFRTASEMRWWRGMSRSATGGGSLFRDTASVATSAADRHVSARGVTYQCSLFAHACLKPSRAKCRQILLLILWVSLRVSASISPRVASRTGSGSRPLGSRSDSCLFTSVSARVRRGFTSRRICWKRSFWLAGNIAATVHLSGRNFSRSACTKRRPRSAWRCSQSISTM
mmetsp:Transcript_7719/g.15742  ORF Transcript_7719/g.15742 Transcript_7719/m.15742 type:complete len:268 (-) Transcript_7719:434-1237(-)